MLLKQFIAQNVNESGSGGQNRQLKLFQGGPIGLQKGIRVGYGYLIPRSFTVTSENLKRLEIVYEYTS